MKKLTQKLIPCCVALAALAPFALAQGNTSPHGFQRPQCTWAADWMASWSGWNLQFSRNNYRDAYLWPDLIRNCSVRFEPYSKSILVIHNAANGGLSTGHVMWVDGGFYVGDNVCYLLVTHSNYPLGSGPRQDWFIWRASDGRVRKDGEATWRRTRGFLVRR